MLLEVILEDDVNCPRCVLPDEIISGDFKPISEYKVGDLCASPDGVATVKEVFRRWYEGSVVKIKACGMLPIILTPEHPILVVSASRTDYNTFTEPYWKSAMEVKPKKATKKMNEYGDYLVVPRVKGYVDVKELELGAFTTARGLSIARSEALTEIPLNEKTAWMFGLYVAEGCSDGVKEARFYLGKHEKDLVSRLVDIISEIGYKPSVREKKTAIEVAIQSRILQRAFRSWFGNRCYNKRIPNFILYHTNDKILWSFLNGYIAGDGCIRKIKRKLGDSVVICAVTTSKVLALQLQLLCARLGVWLSISEHNHSKYASDVGDHVIKGKHMQYIMNATLVKSSGKSRIRILKEYILVPVKEVALEEWKGYVYNLETTSGTYLVNNAIVHNCERLLSVLKKVCDDLNIPFTVKYLGNRAVAAYEESVASRTFSSRWIERWGLKEHKRKLRKLSPILAYLQRIGAQTFPNIVIRWHDGIRMKEIVIRGYDDSDEERARRFVANLYTLLKMLKRVVYER